jgi:transposase-like protein
MTKRNRRTFTEEFKKQIVQLYENGKSKKSDEIIHLLKKLNTNEHSRFN